MADRVLKNNGAGYNLAVPMYPNKLTLKTSRVSLHIVTFQTEHKDTQIQFQFDESYPSRLPKIMVTSPTLTTDQKCDLCELLQRQGKTEEYTNTPLLPLLLEHAVKWLKENYGKKPSVSKTGRKAEERSGIREETWQLSPHSGSGTESVKTGSGSVKTGDSQMKGNHTETSTYQVYLSEWRGPSPRNPSVIDPCPVSDGDRNTTPEVGSDDWCVVPTRTKPKINQGSEKQPQFTIDTVPHIAAPEDHRRANYFVSIRCTNAEIGDAVEGVVKKMLEVDAVYEPICYNRNEVHVTLTTVALHADDEVKAAVSALEDAKNILIDHAPTSCLTISGIDNFQGSKVVYGKVKLMEDVLLLRKLVRWAFQKAGISPRDDYDYQPHMTIAKVNVSFTRKTGLSKISRKTYEPQLNTYFGKQGVKAIHLCKMGSERRADGFYICPTQIDFKK